MVLEVVRGERGESSIIKDAASEADAMK